MPYEPVIEPEVLEVPAIVAIAFPEFTETFLILSLIVSAM